MGSIWTYIWFIVGLIVIVKAGDYFVDAASWAAAVSGVPRFIIGATIVSIATTLPEIIVSVTAALEGNVDMAIGNATGSVIANTGLILSISLIFMPVVIKKKELLGKTIIFIAVIVALWLLSMSGELSRGNGIILFLLFVVFIFENIRSARSQQGSTEKEKVSKNHKDYMVNVVKFLGGAVGIVLGSRILVKTGTTIAENFGIPQNIIGLTIIAIGTSLPELVTTITAITKKQFSLSAGNVIGANIIDTALILPLCALFSKGSIPVSQQTLRIDLPVGLLLAVITLVPALVKGRFSKWQGYVAIILYIAYLVYICFFNNYR